MIFSRISSFFHPAFKDNMMHMKSKYTDFLIFLGFTFFAFGCDSSSNLVQNLDPALDQNVSDLQLNFDRSVKDQSLISIDMLVNDIHVSGQDLALEDLGAQDLGAQDLGIRDLGAQDLGTQDLAIQDLAIQDLSFSLDMTIEDQMLPLDLFILEDQLVNDQEIIVSRDCSPALTLSTQQNFVLPFDLVVFRAYGGSGDYRFELLQNQSGAILNPYTGAYLAGNLLAGQDTVMVTDLNCDGQATASIAVVAPMQVKPMQIQLGRLDQFQFDVQSGSGQFSYRINQNQSGATISANGTYQAGNLLGIDQVEIEDLGTSEVVYLNVEVVNEAKLTTSIEKLFLSKKSQYLVGIQGGSGFYETEWQGDLGFEQSVLTEGLKIKALAQGKGFVVVRDQFLGIEKRIAVDVIDSLQYPGSRIGKAQAESHLVHLGDLNGDQLDDFALGLGETDVGALESGAVYIYYQNNPQPVQVLSMKERQARFGRALFAKDLNRDGKKDLMVGAYTADKGTSGDNGALYIYYALADGTYPNTPSQILYGSAGSDQFGFSVTACDFNGDQLEDIAVSAPAAEGLATNTSQGEVSIFLGNPDGFLDVPDQVLQGKTLNAQFQWQDTANLRLGTQIHCGDLNQDGFSELIVATISAAVPLNRTEDGAIYFYPGSNQNGLLRGGVNELPSLVIVGDEATSPNARLGFRLEVADLDLDQRLELITTQPRHHYFKTVNTTTTEQQDAGAVRVFSFGNFPTSIAQNYTSVTTAAKTWVGDQGFDNFGADISVADVNGDGMPDLLVGATSDEATVMGAISSTGAIRLYLGQPAQQGQNDPWPSTDHSIIIPGLVASDIFGETVLLLGQGKGVSFAGRNNDLGPEVGRPYFISDLTQTTLTPLDMPGDVAGANFGTSIGSGDWNRDGFVDVIVGAPQLPAPMVQEIRSGTSFFYQGDAQSSQSNLLIPQSPTQLIQAFDPVHTSDDLMGFEVANVGDFDGDGYDDLAVIGRTDERPTTWPANYVGDATCLARTNTGAIYLFRGTANGISPKPSYAFYGTINNQVLQKIASPIDINGDGRKDLVVGSFEWDLLSNSDGTGTTVTNDLGGFLVFYGRSTPAANQTITSCTPDFSWVGTRASESLAYSLSTVKDINADGCDELLIGAYADAVNGIERQGAAYLLYGWGSARCGTQPKLLTFSRGDRDTRLGTSVAAGDLDGDGIDEIAIGAYNHNVNNQRRGSVWVLKASQLAAYTPTLFNETRNIIEINDIAQRVDGIQNNERFGWQLAIGAQALIVSAPYYQASSLEPIAINLPRVGEVRFFRMSNGLMQNTPFALMLGENWSFDGQFGTRLHVNQFAYQRFLLGIGAPLGKGNYSDGGSAYLFELTF